MQSTLRHFRRLSTPDIVFVSTYYFIIKIFYNINVCQINEHVIF